MTTLLKSDIPDEINTVEKLHLWSSILLCQLYPNVTAIEDVGSAVRVMAVNPFYITASDPPIWRVITRSSLPLVATWQGGENQMWNYAQEFGDKAIPASFKG